MYLFIAIIFIAELIIASTLIYFIVKADRKVCLLDESILSSRNEMLSVIENIKIVVTELKGKIDFAIKFVVKKKQDYTISLVKNFLMYAFLLLLKGRFKKAASICNLIVMAKDWCSRNC